MQATTRCDDVRGELCRRAVGGAFSQPAELLALHAGGCAACRDFADDLAGVSRWLERRDTGRNGGPVQDAAGTADDPLVQRACLALERELGARLARDLLELGQGRPDRDPASRRLDLVRLVVLRGAGSLRRPPWRGAVRLLSVRRRCIDRRRALRLALQLDPVGLDVALAYLSQLEKEGRRREANAQVDRLLGLLG